VTDEAANIPNPFDVRTIKHLIRLMARYDLSEIDLQEGDLRVRLRRGGRFVGVSPPAALPPAPVPPTPPPAAAAPTAVVPDRAFEAVKSPTPGTYYSSPNPDSPAFVKVGSRVTPTTVVCIIEAMKIFNEIQAECSGVVTEICVENGQPVEYGQVLFKVDPTA
jgi:acetyl-CoA carboxylase biotin carboxyl carrier protein